jgi:hypothetical protein
MELESEAKILSISSNSKVFWIVKVRLGKVRYICSVVIKEEKGHLVAQVVYWKLVWKSYLYLFGKSDNWDKI